MRRLHEAAAGRRRERLVGGHVMARARAEGLAAVGTSTRGGGGLLAFDLLRDAPERLSDVLPIDAETAVVLAAAQTEIRWCGEHPAEARAVNVTAAQRLLAYVVGQAAQDVWFSSDAMFDGVCGHYT